MVSKIYNGEDVSKDEVNYGALVYNAIMKVLSEAKGRREYANDGYEYFEFYSYDGYKKSVEQLRMLLEVIADNEFRREVGELDEWYDRMCSEVDEEVDKHSWLPHISKKLRINRIVALEELKYRYSLDVFKACIRLLERKGVIVEKLLRGMRI